MTTGASAVSPEGVPRITQEHLNALNSAIGASVGFAGDTSRTMDRKAHTRALLKEILPLVSSIVSGEVVPVKREEIDAVGEYLERAARTLRNTHHPVAAETARGLDDVRADVNNWRGFPVVPDPSMPRGRVDFLDEQGNRVGRIETSPPPLQVPEK